ncbi:MAG: DNA translocase FtsK [Eubacteriales bacterium]|nr:DNA translocase FtsK [Eubacteriales bacterium]
MSTAKKKARQTIQSTDRGGPVLLVLGCLLLLFGFLTLLGLTLQTSAASLQVFKSASFGLGGGLYWSVPVLALGWGIALCFSSKRYVSFYPFAVISALLLCAAALMTLLTGVDGYQNLMDYVHNINLNYRRSANPDSMGEYIATAYLQYDGHFAGSALIPGGGALGMLLAFPFWSALGRGGAVTLLIIVGIALIFALLRTNPVSLAQRLGDRAAQRQAQPAAANVQQAAPSEIEPLYQIPKEPYDFGSASQGIVPGEDNTKVYEEPPEAFNSWPSPAYPAHDTPQYDPSDDAGDFVAQPPADLWTNQEPITRPAAEVYAPPVKPIAQAPVPKPELSIPAGAPAVIPAADIARPVENMSVVKYSDPQEHEAQPRRAAVSNSISVPKPVLTSMAVEPSGQRVAIPTRNPLPEKERKPDGTAIQAKPGQVKFAMDDYQAPPMRLLTLPPETNIADTTEEDQAKANRLIETLNSFAIPAQLHHITHGPTVTRFAIRLAEGVNVSKLRSVMDNLTIELKAKGDIRAEIPIPGTSFVGLEVSNNTTSTVYLSEVLNSPKMREITSPTTVALGKDITGAPILAELMDMPHLLIAGATGSGKSVCINSIICSILYRASPRQVRLILIDPKFVELQPYNDVPHLLLPVISDAKKATMALDWVCQEMDERYKTMQKAGVRNLDAYNKKLGPDEEPLPRIVLVVDEMSDLMTTSGKVIEDHIKRITAKARAAGICLILATQRPSVNIITGVIKANIPGRIAFRVSSPFDSKTILDAQGAEKLLGYGDMLFRGNIREPVRVQGCFVSDRDVEQTVEYIKSRNKADYNLDIMEHIEQQDQTGNGIVGDDDLGGDEGFDELLPQAIEMAVEAGQMSISMLQRVLRVGYARAGRLIDEMDRRGIISGNEGTKARKTLMSREQYTAYLEQSEF